jgi:hypothetical protein
MEDKSISIWEARNEAEKVNALEVLYEMATGYVLGELRDEQPENYNKLLSQSRFRSQFVNNVRYSVDAMLAEIIKEYGDEPKEDE